MQKEINSELFGPQVSGGRLSAAETAVSQMAISQLEQKTLELKNQIHGISETLNRWNSQMNEMVKSHNLRFERIYQSLQKMEQKEQTQNLDLAQKLSYLQSKIAERRSMDAKVQELVDRHHGILRSYEVRMNQLQKLIADKDTQVLQAQAALNEAKMEISRMKRL